MLALILPAVVRPSTRTGTARPRCLIVHDAAMSAMNEIGVGADLDSPPLEPASPEKLQPGLVATSDTTRLQRQACPDLTRVK